MTNHFCAIVFFDYPCDQRWAIATLIIASLPLFVKFNSGATAAVPE